jgi:hypothetical protein
MAGGGASVEQFPLVGELDVVIDPIEKKVSSTRQDIGPVDERHAVVWGAHGVGQRRDGGGAVDDAAASADSVADRFDGAEGIICGHDGCKVPEVRRAPALPHMAHAPRILEVVVGDRLQQQGLPIAGFQQGVLIATGVLQDTPHPLARRGPFQGKIVIAVKHVFGLGQEVVRIEPSHMRCESVATIEIDGVARRAPFIASTPIPQRVRLVGELREGCQLDGAPLDRCRKVERSWRQR